jgi:hypothetical protein
VISRGIMSSGLRYRILIKTMHYYWISRSPSSPALRGDHGSSMASLLYWPTSLSSPSRPAGHNGSGIRGQLRHTVGNHWKTLRMITNPITPVADAIIYENSAFNFSIFRDTKYSGQPTVEQDQAWKDLMSRKRSASFSHSHVSLTDLRHGRLNHGG